MNVKLFDDEKLIKTWKNAANNLTEANETLMLKLNKETNITDYRCVEALGKDALICWTDLLGIVKATAIESLRLKSEINKEMNDKILSREEVNNLSKEELSDILEEINRHETDKIKVRTELKNYRLNATNKRLTKHKLKMEGQSRKINKIVIGGKTLTNSDKIKEGIQRYYKYQFRCNCKNKKVPKPCVICKSSPIHYAKVAAKNFKKKTHKQKRLTSSQKEKLEQELTMFLFLVITAPNLQHGHEGAYLRRLTTIKHGALRCSPVFQAVFLAATPFFNSAFRYLGIARAPPVQL